MLKLRVSKIDALRVSRTNLDILVI